MEAPNELGLHPKSSGSHRPTRRSFLSQGSCLTVRPVADGSLARDNPSTNMLPSSEKVSFVPRGAQAAPESAGLAQARPSGKKTRCSPGLATNSYFAFLAAQSLRNGYYATRPDARCVNGGTRLHVFLPYAPTRLTLRRKEPQSKARAARSRCCCSAYRRRSR